MQCRFGLLFAALFVFPFSLTSTSVSVNAQISTSPPPSASTTPPSTTPAQPASDLLKPEQIDALVAPIALYPDALLSQVLIASTYPLEVVEGARWLKSNSNLKADAIKDAVGKQSWDQSIKSLAATPSVLQMMSDKLDWTMKLGDAVLAQQANVMDGIQRLRGRADANNKLTTTKQQKVIKTTDNNKSVIVIEAATPGTIYVPYYNPAVVYGTWPYPAYPPYYWGAPGYVAGAVIATGIAFGTGYAVGRWAAGGWGWGGGFVWGNNNINFNRQININNNVINNRSGFISGQTWHHDAAHRHGVQYRNPAVRQQFAGNRNLSGRTNRMDFRGHNGQQVLRPDAGNRSGAGNRPGGNKAGDRPASGNRAGRNIAKGGNARANRPAGANRPNIARGGRDGAFAHMGRGDFARASAMRGHASFGGRSFGGGRFHGGGGSRGGGFHRR